MSFIIAMLIVLGGNAVTNTFLDIMFTIFSPETDKSDIISGFKIALIGTVVILVAISIFAMWD